MARCCACSGLCALKTSIGLVTVVSILHFKCIILGQEKYCCSTATNQQGIQYGWHQWYWYSGTQGLAAPWNTVQYHQQQLSGVAWVWQSCRLIRWRWGCLLLTNSYWKTLRCCLSGMPYRLKRSVQSCRSCNGLEWFSAVCGLGCGLRLLLIVWGLWNWVRSHS